MIEQQASDMSNEELEFYSRQIVLPHIGYDGQLSLHNAKVCIVGLGGLGSPAALQLAAMGAGHLRLVDYDVVELSNLQRQHLYTTNSVGYPKVEVAAEKLRALNPYIEIEPLPVYVSAYNAEDVISDADLIVDGLDRMSPRYALNRACVKLGIPYVFGAAIMTFGNVSTIIPGETACLECFQRDIDDSMLPTCAVAGIHPSITNLIASIQVSEATRIILGEKPSLANKLLHCDIWHMEFEQIEISKAEDCPICGSKPAAPPRPLKQKMATELCAREGRRTFVITPQRNLALDMDELSALITKLGFEIKVKAKLGITFGADLKPAGSLLKSGVMIIEDAGDEEEAQDLYNKIIVDELQIIRSSGE